MAVYCFDIRGGCSSTHIPPVAQVIPCTVPVAICNGCWPCCACWRQRWRHLLEVTSVFHLNVIVWGRVNGGAQDISLCSWAFYVCSVHCVLAAICCQIWKYIVLWYEDISSTLQTNWEVVLWNLAQLSVGWICVGVSRIIWVHFESFCPTVNWHGIEPGLLRWKSRVLSALPFVRSQMDILLRLWQLWDTSVML